MKKTTIILFILSTLLLHSAIHADIGDWTTFTNRSDVRDISIHGDDIWCATNGGVFKFNIVDSTYEVFTNTSGLSSNDISTLEIDSNGDVWFGLTDGFINIYRAIDGTWDVIDDYSGQKIYDMKFYSDSVFVALDIGVSLYNIARKEVKETYKNLGSGFQVEIPVKSIHLEGRDIWLGTDYGIARSNLDIANLLAPESWTNYTTSNSQVASNEIRSITSLDGIIFVATNDGVSQFDGALWSNFSTGLDIPTKKDVYDLDGFEGTLYAGTTVGVYQFIDNRWNVVKEGFWNVNSLVVDGNGDIWAGRPKTSRSQGFSRFSRSENSWTHIVPPGPAGNNFKGLAVDHDGVLWGCSTTDGIFRFDGVNWQSIRKDDFGFSSDDFWAVKVDNDNNKWFASWGGGVVKIDANDEITFYDHRYLSGINTDPEYIPVTNVTIDNNGNAWFTVYGAEDGNVVAVVTPDGQWQYFSTTDGVKTNPAKELYGITSDRFNRVWVGSRSGITVIDYANTLFDKSDDNLSGTLTVSDGLVNNDVRSLAEDFDGAMWLGTNQGLNYWLGGNVYTMSGVIHDNIQTITVDVRNNKWFGTIGGVSVLAPDNYTWTHYTTENSPLVGANVTAIAFDDATGKVYIGTTNGLSCLETPFAKAHANLDHVQAGPNPYILNDGQKFTIYKLADEVSIKILTPDGMLVRDVAKDDIQGFFVWDGRNDDGEFVSSGVYIYAIYDGDTGDSKIGKIAVVRQ